MSTYVNIQTKWLTEWRLTPSEALVYGYLYGWLVEQRTIPFRQTQAEMARALGMHTNTISNTINALVKKGLIERGRNWKVITYKICDSQNLSMTKNVDDIHKNCELSPTKIVDDTYSNTLYNTNNTLDETRVRTRSNIKNESEAMSVKELVEERQKELSDNSQWSEKAMLYHHITRNQLTDYLNHFADKLEADGVQTKTRGDFLRHFNNWLRIQLEQQTKKNNSNGTTTANNVPGTSISRDYVEQQLAILATAGQ